MIVALPFPLLVLEIALFGFLWSRFGFLPVFAAYWLPSILGVAVLSSVPRLMARLPRGARASLPEAGDMAVRVGARVTGGLLLLAPFVLSRVAGLILLFPPTRWLLIFILQAWLLSRLSRVGGMAFTGSVQAFRHFGGGPRTMSADEVIERDVSDGQPQDPRPPNEFTLPGKPR